MDYFNLTDHTLAASVPSDGLHIESSSSLPPSAEWWIHPTGQPTPSTPPREQHHKHIDGLPDSSHLPSSPAAMFLSGFVSPPPDTSSASRSSTLPDHRPQPIRPALTRLEIRAPTSGDEEGSVVSGYELGPVIGHGGFSTVRRAKAVPSDPMSYSGVVAVKIVRRNDPRPGASEARLRLANEARLWSQLSHEHVLPLFKTEERPEATYLFTLYCPAGSLLDIINQHKADGLDGVGMDDAGMLFRQIVRGLRYLHEVVRLVHGDIKLENVLVDDQGSCRIADFGLSKWINDPHTHHQEDEDSPSPSPGHHHQNISVHLSLLRSRGRPRPTNSPFSRLHPTKAHTTSESAGSGPQVPTHPQHWFPPGSLPYAAPELLAPHQAPLAPSPAQDIWALGCVLYALLFGKLPFSDPFEPRLQMKIVRGIWKLPSNCRARSRLSRARASRSRVGRTSNGRSQSRSGSRVRGAIAGEGKRTIGTTTPRRPRSSGKAAAAAMLKSPTSAGFVSNFPPPVAPALGGSRLRSKSRGRRGGGGHGRGRSLTPPPGSALKTIGRVAENVLHGCLCVALTDRWTVSMIDEVGWGVGWDLDVDEAGEEFIDEAEGDDVMTASTSASGSATTASSIMSGSSAEGNVGKRLGLGSVDRDEFGHRYYISPSSPSSAQASPTHSRRTSALFSTTLQMVSSPVDHHLGVGAHSGLQTVLEAAFGSSSEAVDKVGMPEKEHPLEHAKDRKSSPHSVEVREVTEETRSSGGEERRPSRARGKRGKTSRSSSRHGPAHHTLTGSSTPPRPSASSSSASSPAPPPSHEADPFWIFRQGHIPASLSQSFSRPSSRTSSSRTGSGAPSAVASRAASRERDGNAKDWARGRPTNNTGSPNWRGNLPSSASMGTMAQSASCPLPRASDSVERVLDLWRPSGEKANNSGSNQSASPSPSPSPSTPMDGSVVINKDVAPPMSMRRSPSRGRGRGGFGHGASRSSLEEARMHGFLPQRSQVSKPGPSPPSRDVLAEAHDDGEANSSAAEGDEPVAVVQWPWA